MIESEEHTDNNEVTPVDQSLKCHKCQLAVTDEKVKCTVCIESFHPKCLSRKISPVLYSSWQCNKCIEESRLNHQSQQGSSHKSKTARSPESKTSKSKSSSSRSSSALERIEEEKRMKEELLNLRLTELAKINKEYLDQKYSLESDSDNEESSQVSDGKVKEWLEKVPDDPSAPAVVKETLASTAPTNPVIALDPPKLPPALSHGP